MSVIFPGFVRDAGMFHDTGAKLPPGVGTVSPEAVADAVVRAIERNRGEIDVAPVGMRVGTAIASVAPEVAATVIRASGGAKVGDRIGAEHASKR